MAVVHGYVSVIGGLVGSAVKATAKQGGQAVVRQTAAGLERKAADTLTEKGLASLGRAVLAKLPGGVYAFAKILPARVAQIDITQAMRAASGIAKRVGIRTWGRLDRRIIFRGDRRVLVDPGDPAFLKKVGEAAAGELTWDMDAGRQMLASVALGVESTLVGWVESRWAMAVCRRKPDAKGGKTTEPARPATSPL